MAGKVLTGEEEVKIKVSLACTKVLAGAGLINKPRAITHIMMSSPYITKHGYDMAHITVSRHIILYSLCHGAHTQYTQQ